jgi:hypothetical protein
MAVVVNGEVGEGSGSVLDNKGCIRSTPRHKKEDKLPQSVGLPKWGGDRRCNNDAAELQRWGGGSSGSGSSSEVRWCSGTYVRRMGSGETSCPRWTVTVEKQGTTAVLTGAG